MDDLAIILARAATILLLLVPFAVVLYVLRLLRQIRDKR